MTPCTLLPRNHPRGYVRVRYMGRTIAAHRLVWIKKHGKIPDGLEVCHKCDVKNCVELSHLFLGTHSENMQDKLRKGRDHNQKKTMCPLGHKYDYVDPSGSRKCRSCMNLSGRKSYIKNGDKVRARKRVAVLAYYHANREKILERRRFARKEEICAVTK